MTEGISPQDFLVRLRQKMSGFNANLLLNSAMIESGINSRSQDPLKAEEVENLCLKLINKGGPAFHVGQAIYKENRRH